MVDAPPPEAPRPTVKPDAKTPEVLFVLPSDFKREVTAPLAAEFQRLAAMCQLKKKTKMYKSARREFYGTFAVEEFEGEFGTNKNKLASWQKLCRHLGVGDSLPLGSTTECQRVSPSELNSSFISFGIACDTKTDTGMS
ncbi:hypothetical protein BN946_scf184940.g47 [Trametes cinnabarina]|uniref:Uncharacterized protein n=1 Tax=Pycnoporus cinnabarinus TaxID=5643 RepID=A0A060SC19_PYCCI|nr:hypothetical protein BN946_scf184940.g47 [Trametes cinnabarina]